jgi:hypothetical protein
VNRLTTLEERAGTKTLGVVALGDLAEEAAVAAVVVAVQLPQEDVRLILGRNVVVRSAAVATRGLGQD